MNRTEFRKLFKTTGPAVLPVIHVVDAEQAIKNVQVALSEGAQGVFLINHDFGVVDMNNYSGQTQQMEMRKPAFAPGTRVLLVDQWIETGGTMSAGIALVERQQGVVAGIAAVCIEDTEASKAMRAKYKLSSCVLPGSDMQAQCNRQTLDSFRTFTPADCFPDLPPDNENS